jgi:hypothetical protein
MNPFLLPPGQLLADWKAFRQSLAGQSDIEQLNAVARYWGQAPLKTMAYDPEALDTYPTPWEMIGENDWCQNSVAVGMDFTLRLAGWAPDRLRIKMMRDYDISVQRLVVEIDGKYLVNYDHGVAIEIPNTRFDILQTWGFKGRKYEILSS